VILPQAGRHDRHRLDGIQAAPVTRGFAKHLTVFQRSANYSVPARNAPLTAEFRRYIKEHTGDIRTARTKH